MKKYLPFLLAFIFVVSCKPTEKNYKAAYDAALGKREAAKADIDVNLPEGALQQFDGPQLKEVDGVKVYLLNQRIKPVEKDKTLEGNYNVAVGTYKMITNSRAQAQNLKAEGYEAFAAEGTDDMFYTIVFSTDDLSEAVKFYKKYQGGKNRVYVGFPDAPVILFSPK